MAGRRVVNVMDIDVDWVQVQAGGSHLNDPNFDPYGSPLDNIVGALSQDSFQAATFALRFLTFLAATALAVYSFMHRRPQARNNFFGLRIGLLFFVVSRFFAWVYLAVPNSMPLTHNYLFFWLVPFFFQVASDTTVLWTLIRTSLQPMVVASRYSRARGIGLGFTIPYGLAVAANWAMQSYSTDALVGYAWGQISWFGDGDMRPSSFLVGIISSSLGVLWGIVIFALSIRALHEARGLDRPFRLVPKLTIAASVAWIVRCGMIYICGIGIFDSVIDNIHQYSVTPLLLTIFVDLFGLLLFGLLFVCHRSCFAPLHNIDNGYVTPFNNNNDRESPARIEGAGERTGAVELQDRKSQASIVSRD